MVDRAILDRVLDALVLVLNPATDPQTRAAASQYCEEIKELPNAAEYALAVLCDQRSSMDPSIKHFGIGMLVHVVKGRWNTFQNPADKARFQQLSLELLTSGTRDLEQEPHFIKEKIVSLLVEIAKREWPQNWPALVQELCNASAKSDTQAELVLMVFRSLPEEVKLTTALPEKRRKDIMTGLTTCLPELLLFFYKLLEFQFNAYVSAVNENRPSSRPLTLCKAILAAVLCYVEWAPLNKFVEYNYFSVFCELLKHTQFQMQSAEILLLLVSRKGTTPEKQLLLFPMHNPYLPLVHEVAAKAAGAGLECHRFLCRLAQICGIVGENMLSMIAKTEKPEIPESFSQFLVLMTAFFTHPSNVVSSLVLSFWQQLFRCRLITRDKSDLIAPFWREMMPACFEKARILTKEDPPSPSSPYMALDFDTEDDARSFFGAYRGKMFDLLRLGTVFRPKESMEYTASRLQAALAISHNVESVVTEDSSSYATLEVAESVLESIVSGIPSDFFSAPAKNPETSKALDSGICHAANCLLSYNNKNPLLLYLVMSGLKCLSVFFGNHPEILGTVIQKALTVSQFVKPEEVNQLMGQETISARTKALGVLTKLSSSIPNAMLQYLGSLVPCIQQLVGSSTVLDSERIALYETLAILSNSMDTLEKQAVFLDQLLSDALTDWTSTEVAAAVSDVQSLVGYMTSFSQIGTPDELSMQRRKRMFVSLYAIHNVWRRCNPKPPSWAVWPQFSRVLPNMATFIRTLHNIWDPSVRSAVPPDWQAIFKTPDSVFSSALGDRKCKKVSTVPEHLLLNLDRMREFAYNMGGLAASKSGTLFYTTPQMPQIIQATFLSNMACMDNRHLWKLLKTFFAPVIASCPVDMYPHFVEPLLPGFMAAFLDKLKFCWRGYLSREVNSTTDGTTPQEEVLNDKVLRDLTRDYFDWLKRLVSAADKNDTANADFRLRFLLNSQSAAPALVSSVVESFWFPDSQSLQRGIFLARKLVPLLPSLPQGVAMMGAMLATVLQSVHMPTNYNHNADHEHDLATIVYTLVTLLGQTSQTVVSILSSIPTMTEQTLKELLVQTSTTNADMNQRAIKSFIHDLISSCANSSKETILNIPIPVYITKSEVTEETTVDLKSLFDQGQ